MKCFKIFFVGFITMSILLACNSNSTEISDSSGNKLNNNISIYNLEEGEEMPNILLDTNNDIGFDLSKINKPILINFWATWCPPCRAEMPGLQKLYEEYNDRIDFMMINIGESKDEVNSFLTDNSLSFPIAFDFDMNYATQFKITGIPTTFIVGKDKIIKNLIVGARSEEIFKEFIEKAINE